MRHYKVYKDRQIKQILLYNGYSLDHQTGSHQIYKNEKGNHIAIRINNQNPIVFRRIIKENNLNVVI